MEDDASCVFFDFGLYRRIEVVLLGKRAQIRLEGICYGFLVGIKPFNPVAVFDDSPSAILVERAKYEEECLHSYRCR